MEMVADIKRTNGLKDFKTLPNGAQGVPIYLLVLGSLRAFDAMIEELTCVSEETHRVFFHNQFCMWGAKVAPVHIKMPDDSDSVRDIMALYERLGLPGCAGSIDCVHVVWDKCPAMDRSACKGKDKVTTLAFQVVGSHTKRIHSVSQWFHGTWNDKSIARYDKVFDLFRRKGSFLSSIKWTVWKDRSCREKLRFIGFAAKELGEAKTKDLKERTTHSFITIVTKADINADAKELKCDPLDAKEADLMKQMLLQWGRENSDGVSCNYFILLYYCYDNECSHY